MMKRELHTDSVNTLLDRLSQEHELFYFQMISRTPKEVYENCGIIRFYDSLWEYFQYKENLDKEHVNACLKESRILPALYNLYLKYEHFKIGTWDEIEELLDKEADIWKQREKAVH